MAKEKPVKISKKQLQAGLVIEPNTPISLSKLRAKLGETMNRVQWGKECVVVKNYGKKLAQIIPVPED